MKKFLMAVLVTVFIVSTVAVVTVNIEKTKMGFLPYSTLTVLPTEWAGIHGPGEPIPVDGFVLPIPW